MNSPKGVDIRGLGEWQVVGVGRLARAQAPHQLGGEVAQPACRDAQRVTGTVAKAQFGDAEEPKVRDDHLAVFQEDVLTLQVLVYDASRMQVAHALQNKQVMLLCCLHTGDIKLAACSRKVLGLNSSVV